MMLVGGLWTNKAFALGAPVVFAGTGSTTSSINFYWYYPDFSYFDGQVAQYSLDGAYFNGISFNWNGSIGSATVDGLDPAQVIYVRVLGYEEGNPNPIPSDTVEVQSLPDPPDLTATLNEDNTVILEWSTTYSTDDLMGFEVLRSDYPTTGFQSVYLCMPYEDSTVDYLDPYNDDEHKTYYYQIVAYNMQWESSSPGDATARLEVYAPTITGAMIYPSSNYFSWYDNSSIEEYYEIYRGESEYFENADIYDIVYGSGSMYYDDSDIDLETTYHYWIFAYDDMSPGYRSEMIDSIDFIRWP